jgi:hypothetical protein
MLKKLAFAFTVLVCAATLTTLTAQEDEEFSETVVVYPPTGDGGTRTEPVYIFRDEFYDIFPGLINRPLPEPPPLPDNPGDGGQQPEPGPCDDLRDLVQEIDNGIAEVNDFLTGLQNGNPYVAGQTAEGLIVYLPGTSEHKGFITRVEGWLVDDGKNRDDAIGNWGDCIFGNK